ncbi:MAG TPA: Ig-like domain-containing protein, partial [Gaiellaceae bacterium]
MTGPYTFWVAADDSAELWLSSDDSILNRSRIATIPTYVNPREWTRTPAQQSAPIMLIGGRRYFIEALHKESTGGDHLAVAWQVPGRTLEVIPGTYLSPPPPPAPIVSLTSTPASGASVPGPAAITLSATASSSAAPIAKVEFLNNGVYVGEAALSPYTLALGSVRAGTYVLTARAVDSAGSTTVSNSVTITVTGTQGGGTGSILREYWPGIGTGSLVSDLTSVAGFPTSPSGTGTLTLFEAPSNWGDAYGQRVRGLLYPPISGLYRFWIASDDSSELWLSTDDAPSTRVKIASLTGATGPRNWTAYASQASVPIYLASGQKYYIEALHKEATGSDNLAVAWLRPGGALEVIPGAYLSLPNTPPSVQIASPAPGTSFTAPASIPITVYAADPDGTIAKVEFFQGVTKLGETTVSPFSFTWGSVPVGTYSVTARATDNGGAVRTSRPVAVVVRSSAAAISSLVVSPVSVPGGAVALGIVTLNAGAPSGGALVTLTSSPPGLVTIPASVSVPAGATAATFPIATTSVASSTVVTITATYGGSLPATLTLTPATVDTPSVAISCPTSGALFPAGFSVPLSVSTSATRGILKVEYYANADTTPFATGTISPYSATYTIPAGLPEGTTFPIRAKVYDLTGVSSETAVTIAVVTGDVFAVDTTVFADDPTHDYGTLIVTGGTTTLIGSHPLARLIVLSGARVLQVSAVPTVPDSLSLVVSGALYVACGGSIDASGRGYPNNTSYPGAVLPGDATGGSHLGYGGLQNNPLGSTYGSVYRPQEAGGGAGNGGPGGGIVRITSGSLTLDGAIRANGDKGTSDRTGAGGSVWVTTGAFSGAGTISPYSATYTIPAGLPEGTTFPIRAKVYDLTGVSSET